MKISTQDWLNYINRLSRLSSAAGEKMRSYIENHGYDDRDALINYAYALVTKYGEGSAELACQMYDAISEMENVSVPSAYPAATATYQETAKAINGSLKQSPGGNLIDSVAQRLVKQASADTMLKNAKRDGAYFAWIPHGDTCPYCLMMGGIGWQKAGKSTLNGNHADHIHAHCDCQYVVDFKGNLQVSDYDPDKLQNEMLEASGYDDYSDFLADNAKKSTKGNRTGLNAVRRMRYEENKDVINAQKRAAYAKRKALSESLSQNKHKHKINITDVAIKKVNAIDIPGYSDIELKEIQNMNIEILKASQKMNNSNEVAMIYTLGGKTSKPVLGTEQEVNIFANTDMFHMLYNSKPRTLVLSHNHPSLSYFSVDDVSIFIRHPSIDTMEVVTNNGKTWYIKKNSKYNDLEILQLYNNVVKDNGDKSLDNIVEEFLKKAYNSIERN